MMGVQATLARLFYDFCLDDHVPSDHILRSIDRHLDLDDVRQALKPFKPPKVVLEREIYGGAQRALWEQLGNLPESAKSVLLIGHNPALQDLALELVHADLNRLLESAGGKFPTGAMASFRFDGAWKALEPHGAVLASYITPKAIAASSHDRREHVLQRCR